MELSIIVTALGCPSAVEDIVSQLNVACCGLEAEIVLANGWGDERAALPGTLLVRSVGDERLRGGPMGAVAEGIRSSSARYCIVIAGDRCVPVPTIRRILAMLRSGEFDVVTAAAERRQPVDAAPAMMRARYRRVSLPTMLARFLFPQNLGSCSDPFTGYFGVVRNVIDVGALDRNISTPLLAILVSRKLHVAEFPMACPKQHTEPRLFPPTARLLMILRIVWLRCGRFLGFGAIGAIGAVLNLLIVGAMVMLGVHYLPAAVVAAELTIFGNFVMQERFVFNMRTRVTPVRVRFLQSFLYNNVDAALRLPLLGLLVEMVGMGIIAAQASTLAGAFVVRYFFHALIVYRPIASPEPTDLMMERQ